MSNEGSQYWLWEYEKIGELKADKIYIVKNMKTGHVAVEKLIRSEQKQIYLAIKEIDQLNLPKIYDVFDEGGECVVLREYVEGESLQDYQNESRIFENTEIKSIATQICDALIALHHHIPPIIHRDVKLSNVIMTDDGNIKLLDFDAARFYDENANNDTVEIGTHGYAAPEAYGFHQTDARSDIYSLGVLLNLLITGKKPNEQLAKGRFRNIIKKCTDLSPRKRYRSVTLLKRAISIGRRSLIVVPMIAIAVLILAVTLHPWIQPDDNAGNLIATQESSGNMISKNSLDALSAPLRAVAEVWDTYDLAYPKDDVSSEYIDYFLFCYCNEHLFQDMQEYDGIDFYSSYQMTQSELNELLSSVFGEAKFDLEQYAPQNDNIVIRQDDFYYIAISEPPFTQLAYMGEAPLEYDADSEYTYTSITQWPGETASIVDVYVTLIKNDDSSYGYNINSVRFGTPSEYENEYTIT